MKYVNRFISVVVLVLVSVVAFAGDEIEIKVGPMPHSPYGFTNVYIQSVDDSVAIRNVVINRGNCTTNYPFDDKTKSFPKQKVLKYGETFIPSTVCKVGNVREITVTTDKQSYTYNW